jgi:hypothetical protein
MRKGRNKVGLDVFGSASQEKKSLVGRIFTSTPNDANGPSDRTDGGTDLGT